MEAEHGHAADNIGQTAFCQQLAAVFLERALQFFQVVEELFDRGIRLEEAEFAAHAQTE